MKRYIIFGLFLGIILNSVFAQENIIKDKEIPTSTILYWAKKENKLHKFKNYKSIKDSGFIYYGLCSDSGSGIKEVALFLDNEQQKDIEIFYSTTPITELELASKRKFTKWLIDVDYTKTVPLENEGKQIFWKIRAEKKSLKTGKIYIKTTDWNNNENIQNPADLFIKIYKKDMFGNNITGLYIFIIILVIILLAVGVFLYSWSKRNALKDCLLYSCLTISGVIVLWLLFKLLVLLFKIIKGNIKIIVIILLVVGVIIGGFFLIRFCIEKDIFQQIYNYFLAIKLKRQRTQKIKEEKKLKKKQQVDSNKQQKKLDAERKEKFNSLKNEQQMRLIEQETQTISDDIKNITAITNDIEEYSNSKQLTPKILFDNLQTIEMDLIQIDSKRSEKIVLTENQKRELKRNKEKLSFLLKRIKISKEEKKQMSLLIKSIKSYYKNFIK